MPKFSQRLLARGLMWLAACVLVVQPQLLLAETGSSAFPPQPTRVLDVALHSGGTLQGQLAGSQGRPLAVQEIRVSSGQNEWRVKTDAAGKFTVTGLSGTTYRIQAGNHVQLVRAWAPGTAPPGAIGNLMIVPDDSAVLGQNCGSPVCGSGVCCKKNCLRNPLVLGAIVAAAIAIPIALENSDDDPSST